MKVETETSFRRYPHLERLGSDDVEGILDGECYIFYKIDGTNASVWLDDNGQMQFGSRNRVLSLDKDNAGFMNSMCKDKRLYEFFQGFPEFILYGEWLVPHSLKTYRDDAWRKFYIFDVMDKESGQFLSYERYQDVLEAYELDYIPPLVVIKNPKPDDVFRCLDKSSQFLIKDGAGTGEGIVIKNYEFTNKFGRTNWAKVITNEFKEIHHKEMGAPLVNGSLVAEDLIVDKYCTTSLIDKEKAKIINEVGEWKSELIPRLLNTVFHCVISEEIWNILKEHKNPTINFRLLNNLVIRKVKKVIGI